MEATNLSPLLAGCAACTETCYCEACCDALGDSYDAEVAATEAAAIGSLSQCPSCTGHGHHGNGADCSTCTGLGRVDLALLRWPCTLDFAAAYAAEWSLGAYDYLQADDVVAHLDDRGQHQAAWAVAVHSLTSNAGDRIRKCWSCRAVVLDGECEDCAEHVARVEPEGREYDKYTHGMVA